MIMAKKYVYDSNDILFMKNNGVIVMFLYSRTMEKVKTYFLIKNIYFYVDDDPKINDSCFAYNF